MILNNVSQKFDLEKEFEKLAFERLSGLNFERTCNLHGVSSLEELAELNGFFKKIFKQVKRHFKKIAKIVKKVAPIALGIAAATMIPGVGPLIAGGISSVGGVLKKVAGSGAVKGVIHGIGGAITGTGKIIGGVLDSTGNVISGTGKILADIQASNKPTRDPYQTPGLSNDALPLMTAMLQQQGIVAQSNQAQNLLRQELESQRQKLAAQATEMRMLSIQRSSQPKNDINKYLPYIIIGGIGLTGIILLSSKK